MLVIFKYIVILVMATMSKSVDGLVDKLIGLVILLAMFVALAPTVLIYIGNLSTTGVVLAATISTIAGLLFAFFGLKLVMKALKS